MTPRTPKVEVVWQDAASPHGDSWESAAEARKFTGELCSSIGYLIEKGPEWLVLAGGRSSGGDVMLKMAIPRGCVREIRMLEVAEAPKRRGVLPESDVLAAKKPRRRHK